MDCATSARGQGTVEILLVSVLVAGLLFFGASAILKIRGQFKHQYAMPDYLASPPRAVNEAVRRIDELLAKKLVLFDSSAKSSDFARRLEAEGWSRSTSIVNSRNNLLIFLKDGCQFTVTSQVGVRQCGLD